jgi:WD40 repeat protein
MLFRLSDGVLLNHFVGTNGLVTYDVMFSLDGQTVLTGEGAIFLTGPGGAIRYWDIATQTAVRVLTDHAFSVHALAMSPDGQTFASASHDQTIKLWNLADGELLDTLTGHTNAVTGVDFVGDGTTLVSSSVDATVRIWNTATGELTQTITGFDDAVGAVEFSPDGQHILASGGKFNLQVSDPAVRLIRLADGRIEQTLTQFNSVFESVAISPDDRWVAVGGSSHEFTSGLVAIRSAIDGSLVRMINGGTWVNAIAFSPDGGRIASAGFDNLVKIWNPETGDLIRTLTGHPDEIYALAYSPGGEFLASAGWNNPIRIWNPESGALLQQLSGLNPSGALSLAFSPDGTLLAAGIDRYAHIVRVSDWQHIHSVIHVPVTTGGTVRTVAFSPDGAVLAVSGTPNVTLWNPNTGALLRTLSGHTSDVRTLAFTPDGAFLISGCERTDLSLRVWRVADGAQVASFDDGTGSGARRVAVSSDGRQVAIAQSDSTLSVVRSPAGPLAGDVDGNGAYTSVDHAAFVDCLSGPAVPVGDDYQCAVVFDLTNDGHVDLQDFAALK